MRLRVREGRRIFEVQTPPGCQVVGAGARPSGLLIPGPTPASTSIILPRAELLGAARAGHHGLLLVGEIEAPPRPGPVTAPELPAARLRRPGRVSRDEAAEFLGRDLPGGTTP